MTSVAVKSDTDRRRVISAIEKRDPPFTVSLKAGVESARSLEQNRLQRLWISEVSEQLGDEKEAVRAYMKLRIGVPILREEDEDFRTQYDSIVKPLPYEQKIELMREPIDFPVTRLMTKKQKGVYLDQCYHHFSEQGLYLTEPDFSFGGEE